jgi:hypothetical protein
MADPHDPDGRELTSAVRALLTAVDTIEAAAPGQPGVDLLAGALPSCVHLTGLVASLAGCLGALADELADAHAALPGENPFADIAVDLATMRHFLHRATLAAAPTLSSVRRGRLTPADGWNWVTSRDGRAAARPDTGC